MLVHYAHKFCPGVQKTPFKHLWLFKEKLEGEGQRPMMQYSLQWWEANLRIFSTIFPEVSPELGINHHVLALKGN